MSTHGYVIRIFLLCIPGLFQVTPLFSGSMQVPAEVSAFSAALQSEEEQDEEEPAVPASRQNLILRAYFRRQYLNLRSERYDLNETFMERYVDRQIDAFLDDIDARLEKLGYWLGEAEQAHFTMLNTNDFSQRTEAKIRLSKALKEVDSTAGGLKGKLLNIFLELDSKEKLPIEISSEDDYRQEMAFLREQIDVAESRIRDYLFLTTNTVPYLQLKGENMLIRLYWAEKTADGIRDKLRR